MSYDGRRRYPTVHWHALTQTAEAARVCAAPAIRRGGIAHEHDDTDELDHSFWNFGRSTVGGRGWVYLAATTAIQAAAAALRCGIRSSRGRAWAHQGRSGAQSAGKAR